MVICAHEKLDQVRPPEHSATWGGWRTKAKCSPCGYWNHFETSGAHDPAPGTQEEGHVALLSRL